MALADGLAALLFVFDVAARRLRLGWMDAERAWAYVLDSWLGRARQVAAPAATRLLAAKGRISIEGTALVTGRRGPNGRNGEANVGATVAGSARTASSSALGARLLDAKKRAGPASTSSTSSSSSSEN